MSSLFDLIMKMCQYILITAVTFENVSVYSHYSSDVKQPETHGTRRALLGECEMRTCTLSNVQRAQCRPSCVLQVNSSSKQMNRLVITLGRGAWMNQKMISIQVNNEWTIDSCFLQIAKKSTPY